MKTKVFSGSIESNYSGRYGLNAFNRRFSQLALLRQSTYMTKEIQSMYIEGSSGDLIPLTKKTPEDSASIINAFNSHFIFSCLTEEDKELIAEYMQLYSYQESSYIFKQGMPSKSFYVIKSGTVEVIVNRKKVNKLNEGDGFGELALISSSERSATMRCLRPTTVWMIERDLFKKLIEDISTQTFEQNRMFLDKIQLLSSLHSEQKDSLAASMISFKFKSGQTIVKEGEKGDTMYIIKEGKVLVFKNGKEVNQLKSGSIFGEQALITHTVRNATCMAYGGAVYCVCLSQETIQQVLKYGLKEIIQRNYVMEAFNKSSTLAALKNFQKEAILKELKIIEYNSGDVVIHKGENCSNKLYVIISGRMQNSRNIHLFADKGFCIGDEFLGKGLSARYEDDFIAGCNMEVGEITKYQLEMILGGKYEDIIKENSAINVLRKVWLFDAVDDCLLKEIICKVRVLVCEDSEIILKEGRENREVFIVKKGKVEVFRCGKLVRTVTRYGFFGENCLLDREINASTFVASRGVQLWIIDCEDFSKVVNEKMLAQLKKREECYLSKILLKDLYPVKELGRGLFSRVFLMSTENHQYYALKTYTYKDIKKLYINQQILVRSI